MDCSDVSNLHDTMCLTGEEASQMCPDDFRSFREIDNARVEGPAVNEGRREGFGWKMRLLCLPGRPQARDLWATAIDGIGGLQKAEYPLSQQLLMI